MKSIGKVRVVCVKEEGQSASGNFWEKQTLVVDVPTGEKDVPIAIGFFGERRTVWLKDLKPGDFVSVAYAPESREYQGRWYTELVGFGLKRYTPDTNNPSQRGERPAGQQPTDLPPTAPMMADAQDELGF